MEQALAKIPQKVLKVRALEVMKTHDIDSIRASIPGQAKLIQGKRNLDLARVEFGLAYTKVALNKEILSRIPKESKNKLRSRYSGYRIRTVVSWIKIEKFGKLIPDRAIHRYQMAKDSGLFDEFFVLDMKNVKVMNRPVDPWLVGRVAGVEDGYVVLAYWDEVSSLATKLLRRK